MASAIKQAQDEVAAQRPATLRTKIDAFRSSFAGGRVMLTQGVNALADEVKGAVLNAVQAFDDFSPTNDPHGEHDFGAITLNDAVFLWKIDYYDRDLQCGSPDPADDALTCRVLTIMRTEEYRRYGCSVRHMPRDVLFIDPVYVPPSLAQAEVCFPVFQKMPKCRLPMQQPAAPAGRLTR